MELLGFLRCESFRKFGVPYFGVLVIRILYYSGCYIRVPYFRKLPCCVCYPKAPKRVMGFLGAKVWDFTTRVQEP